MDGIESRFFAIFLGRLGGGFGLSLIVNLVLCLFLLRAQLADFEFGSDLF